MYDTEKKYCNDEKNVPLGVVNFFRFCAFLFFSTLLFGSNLSPTTGQKQKKTTRRQARTELLQSF